MQMILVALPDDVVCENSYDVVFMWLRFEQRILGIRNSRARVIWSESIL